MDGAITCAGLKVCLSAQESGAGRKGLSVTAEARDEAVLARRSQQWNDAERPNQVRMSRRRGWRRNPVRTRSHASSVKLTPPSSRARRRIDEADRSRAGCANACRAPARRTACRDCERSKALRYAGWSADRLPG